MKENIGSLDKTIRLVAGTALLAAAVFYSPWLALPGIILLGTGLASRCPLYLPLHISTR